MKYVFILAMLLASNTQALEIDLGVGRTFTDKPANGLWYQKEFEHSIDQDSTNYQIGLRFHPWDNIYVTTGYKYLGKFSISADFIANDTTYAEWQKGGKAPPVSNLTGSGKAHGLYAKLEYHFQQSPFFVTGGWWAHKSEWKVRSPAEMRMRRYGAKKGQIHGPYDITHEDKSGLSVSWIIGAGVKFGRVSILAEIWDTTSDTEYPATYLGESQVITLLYTF